MRVEVMVADVGAVDADALLIAVDASLRVPGGAAWRAYINALDPDEREDVAKFLEADIRALPLREGGAATIAAHGKLDRLVIASTLLHERDGVVPSSSRMLDVLERGARSACESAADAGVHVLAATLIGDRRAGLAHNHPVTTAAAIDAMWRGFTSANRSPIVRVVLRRRGGRVGSTRTSLKPNERTLSARCEDRRGVARNRSLRRLLRAAPGSACQRAAPRLEAAR